MLYPAVLNLKDKRCLVIGGGDVASRKVKSLLECGAKVKLVSPELSKEFKDLKGFKYIKRKFKKNDLKGMFLVISATDDLIVNEKVSIYTKKKNILVNVVDNPELCTFFVPSVIRRGPLIISISTSGSFPLLAKIIKEELEKKYDNKFGEFIKKAGKIRRIILKGNPGIKRKIFKEIKRITLKSPNKIKEIKKFNEKQNSCWYTR